MVLFFVYLTDIPGKVTHEVLELSNKQNSGRFQGFSAIKK